ncbi:hypothetical protein GCM10010505_39890 [Kitasatospora aburaviensis]
MWTYEETVAAGHSMDPARWREAFEVAMGRIAGRFARVEPRLRAGRLVLGLLSDLQRKNCWTIARGFRSAPHLLTPGTGRSPARDPAGSPEIRWSRDPVE